MFNAPIVNQYGNHMVMTNVSKPSKTKLVSLDTRFCDEYSVNFNQPSNVKYNSTDYTLTLPERLTNIKSAMVCDVELPMAFFNISASLKNNTVRVWSDYFDDGATLVNYVLKIPDGVYTVSSLITALNNLFLNSANYQGSYFSMQLLGNRVVLNVETQGYFYIDFAVSDTGDFDKYDFKSKIGWMLGFRNSEYKVFSSNPLTSESAYQTVFGPKYLYLAINEFSRGNQNSFHSLMDKSILNKDIIAKIIMDYQRYPYGSILPANTFNGYLVSDRREYTGKVDIQKMNVKLVDERGNLVNLGGNDFSFTLQFEYE